MNRHLLQITAVLSAAFLADAGVLNTKGGTFELLILHNNDMHARFEQTSQLSGICTPEDQALNKCYGGFARVATVVKEARNKAKTGEGPPVLYLNAGDTYTGSAWFTIYKWKIAAEFINALQPDAVSLGNNEIKAGSSKLSPFVHELKSPVVASNVILKSDQDEAVLHKSLVFDVEGTKVGLVGYLKLDKTFLDRTGNVEYIDEIIALKEEVAKLQEHDVNIIIAIGNSDLEMDVEIAKEVDGIDIVIGGAKNVFFWNGTCISKTDDKAMVINRQTGTSALVLQSHAYNKNLGGLHVEFDINGGLRSFNDYLISLDSSIPQDLVVSRLLATYSDEISATSEEIIGTTAVVLDGDSCKTKECNLGNLITDAMMLYYASRYEGDTWTDTAIAVIPSGMISGSIAPADRPGDVTLGDLRSVLPSESKIVKVTTNGAVLLEILEHSVSTFNVLNPTGQFLQMSGITLTYDLNKEIGSRVVDARVRCWSCVVPTYYEIENWRTYTLLMPESLANGDYGYVMISSIPKEELEYDEITCITEFMKLRQPVYPEEAGRIELINLMNEDVEEGGGETGDEGADIVGTTAVVLDGESCKTKECNLGNLITDAMMLYYASRYVGDTWTDSAIAVIPSGMISGSIAPIDRPGTVTLKDLQSVLPSGSKIVKVTMNGAVLLEILEHSVSTFNVSNPTGQFLQMSGVRLTYDLSKEIGSRVVNAVVRCWSCVVPTYYEIENWRTYLLLMPESLTNGDYGYRMISSLSKEELEYDEITCIREFMKFRKPVYPEEAGRIEIVNLIAEDVNEDESGTEGDSETEGGGETEGDGETEGGGENEGDGETEDDNENESSSAGSLSVTFIFMSMVPLFL